MSDFSVGATWKSRKEPITACADRLHRFLMELSVCDPVFSKWFKLGMSRRKALQAEIDFKNKDYLLGLLERGRHRKDFGNEVMEDLGFGVGMWNGGKSTKMVGLSITCGLYSTVPGIGNNYVKIDLPEELGDLRQTECMTEVLAVLAKCWEPDWGGVISTQSKNTRTGVPGKPFVDWMLYVSNKLILNPNVPEPSLVKPVDSIGSLIIVQPEPVEADNPVHLQRVKAVEAVLRI